jgi:hypothetical protein
MVTPQILEIKPLQIKDFSAEDGGSELPSANKDNSGGFFGKGLHYNELKAGQARKEGSILGLTNFFESKLYLMMTIILALAYFVDVFVGMFLLHREYLITDMKSAVNFDNDRRYKEFIQQHYNPIEIALLSFMVLENLIKLVYATKNPLIKRVSQFN